MTTLFYFLLGIVVSTSGLSDSWQQFKNEWPTVLTVTNFETTSAQEFLQGIMARSAKLPSRSKSNKGGGAKFCAGTQFIEQ